MKIFKTRDYYDMSRKAANIISAQIILKPDCVLGLATGSSPLGTYKQLVEWYKKEDLDFSKVSTVNLDEYRGLSPQNEQSYYYFMHKNLFSQVNIRENATFVPDGMNNDIEKACKNHEDIINRLGGIDLQLLGLGENGHIGFNEPADEFIKDTHCVQLSRSTIEANSRFFKDIKDVPTQAITMGIRTIMRADKILIIVNGSKKAKIVKEAFWGPVTPKVPASILQIHKDVTLVADEAALSQAPI